MMDILFWVAWGLHGEKILLCLILTSSSKIRVRSCQTRDMSSSPSKEYKYFCK